MVTRETPIAIKADAPMETVIETLQELHHCLDDLKRERRREHRRMQDDLAAEIIRSADFREQVLLFQKAILRSFRIDTDPEKPLARRQLSVTLKPWQLLTGIVSIVGFLRITAGAWPVLEQLFENLTGVH